MQSVAKYIPYIRMLSAPADNHVKRVLRFNLKVYVQELLEISQTL
jgi:hypothetical protein